MERIATRPMLPMQGEAMKCPHCNQQIDDAEIAKHLGAKGGAKSRGGGRPPAKKPSKEALYRREYRRRKGNDKQSTD